MTPFKTIDYGKMLYESLTYYFSVNSDGDMSILYKILAACIQPLQSPFNSYDSARRINAIVANCKWQIGQLTNVLNYLYDNTLKRIYITQSVIGTIADPTFDYDPINFDDVFGNTILITEREFFDQANITAPVIHVPVSVSLSQITATIEQIKLDGVSYTIEIF